MEDEEEEPIGGAAKKRKKIEPEAVERDFGGPDLQTPLRGDLPETVERAEELDKEEDNQCWEKGDRSRPALTPPN